MDALKIENLTKNYPNFTLDNVSFSVPGGSVVGLIGENGAGKTTVLKAALGLMKPDRGRVEIFGKDVTTITGAEKSRIGVVLDDVCLPESVTVKKVGNIMGGMIAGWDGARYAELMRRFALPADKEIGKLSKGMKMKTAIAVAMSHGAKLLILDEATSGLDPVARDEILDLLYEFVTDDEHAVLMSSHIVEDLRKICDHVVFIHGGKIVFRKTSDELRDGYAVAGCSDEQLAQLPQGSVIRVRRTPYSLSVLMDRSVAEKCGLPYERAGIEDIMLFYIKGEEK